MEDLALTAPVRDRVGGRGGTISSEWGATPFLLGWWPGSLLSELAVNATETLLGLLSTSRVKELGCVNVCIVYITWQNFTDLKNI